MREHYDFKDAAKNPYAAQLKRQITINLDADTVEYFKAQAQRTGIPYQKLINFYLTDCARQKKTLVWG